MPQDLGTKLYSFAVITDTHLNQGEDECNSPFDVNRLANRRMRHVIRDLNHRDLAFVVNAGDLVHPVPAIPDLYEEAAARFHELAAELEHPLYLVPGNHDVGDKPNDWAPAAGVSDAHLKLWEKHFGAQYQSFEYDSCRFILINAQLINSGLAEEEIQRQWLEEILANNRDQRLFLCSHYPPYFSRPDEEENYDNLGEPGRSWFLSLMAQYKIEAFFAGHVHNFWYYKHGSTDCYLLPSTAFVRQDYSEMFHVPPSVESEFGRNDKPKLGYFIVQVYEQGHICEPVRTYGAMAEDDTPVAPAPDVIAPVHPRQNRFADLGFDMRQNWMEIVEIPPTGGLDEFDRKEVRNDYPLLAMWEMGVRRLRVPLRDLLIEENRDRMRALRTQGLQFTLSTFGDPDLNRRDLILNNQDIFSAWEIGFNWETLDQVGGGIGRLARETDIPVFLSRLRSIDEQRSEAGKYYHMINQGFTIDDRSQLETLLNRPELEDIIAGFVFRLPLDQLPLQSAAAIQELANDLDIKASIHLRLIGGNPALETADEAGLIARITEAMLAAASFERITIYADTLADNDRGYFPRMGVLDRLWNPRQGFHAVRNLNGALNQLKEKPTYEGEDSLGGVRIFRLSAEKKQLILVLPKMPIAEIGIPIMNGTSRVQRIDLLTGIVETLNRRDDSRNPEAVVSLNKGPALLLCD